jgi:hypothetical protein
MSTKVVEKEFSPLTVRKYTNLHMLGGLPVFVALITDDDLNSLDNVVHEFTLKYVESFGKPSGIQWFRCYAGALTQHLSTTYRRSEGIAVIVFPDKTAVSSLWGDFMNHLHCRMELYALINTMWHL